MTVLHFVTERGNLELVQWLVEHGADVNAKNQYGYTVLYFGVRSENQEFVEWLKEQGAEN